MDLVQQMDEIERIFKEKMKELKRKVEMLKVIKDLNPPFVIIRKSLTKAYSGLIDELGNIDF